MRKRLLVLLAAVVAVLGVTTMRASAINYGQVDDGAHPYGALTALFDEEGNYVGRCSGSLIDEDVVVTAAHCTDGVAHAHIFFTEDLRGVDFATATNYDAVGTPHAMPGWTGSLTTPDTHDLAVFTLDRALLEKKGYEYAELAPVGFLDEMATKRGQQDTYFTTVGYGLQQPQALPDQPVDPHVRGQRPDQPQQRVGRRLRPDDDQQPRSRPRRQLLRRLRRPDPLAGHRHHRRGQQLRSAEHHRDGARVHLVVPRPATSRRPTDDGPAVTRQPVRRRPLRLPGVLRRAAQ
ncbi:MAG TPA: trypsin-like serine protease [Mycobacteriales bacterium]|nr:trypsin-like serine protease [Mycobacteriales bacterium]